MNTLASVAAATQPLAETSPHRRYGAAVLPWQREAGIDWPIRGRSNDVRLVNSMIYADGQGYGYRAREISESLWTRYVIFTYVT